MPAKHPSQFAVLFNFHTEPPITKYLRDRLIGEGYGLSDNMDDVHLFSTPEEATVVVMQFKRLRPSYLRGEYNHPYMVFVQQAVNMAFPDRISPRSFSIDIIEYEPKLVDRHLVTE